MSPARPTLAAAVLSCVSFLVPGMQAQVTQVNDTTSTPVEGAGHNYIKLLSESVNPANGSVSLRIQVPIPKGRGITVPFAFAYDSNGVNHLAPFIWTDNLGGSGGSGYLALQYGLLRPRWLELRLSVSQSKLVAARQ